jgi:N-acetylglucosaminyldiphosphoundecaprenol N-acetyl-beta-D-mannosaminyltransferase
MTTPFPTVRLLGLPVTVIDPAGVVEEIARLIARPGCALVNNVNVNACNLAFDRPEFRRILSESEVVFCDGFGVRWGARLLGLRLGPRMTPPDWIDLLFRRGVAEGWSFFFLGDEPAVAERFAASARERHSGLCVAGTHPGYFEIGSEADDSVVRAIRAARPDVVLTAMGMPRQEIWADRARGRLDHGVLIATGALFRWYTGIERRAPKWLSERGGEGLYRLARNPVRHFRRYVLGVPRFFFRILRERLRGGPRGGGA